MARLLSIVAMALACIAIAYAVWLHRTTNERVRAAVADAVRAREEALIREWKPMVHEMFRDMKLAGVKAEPKTLEELLSPLFHLMCSFPEDKPGPSPSPR